MLLNEFLKEHCKVETQEHRIQEQEATITQLNLMLRSTKPRSRIEIHSRAPAAGMDALAASLKEQNAQIQK
jgi:hypothetical protein